MKFQHYITFDRGGGPVTFVQVSSDDGIHMIRITHNARFDQVKEVDPITTRNAVEAAQDLGDATTKVKPELAQRITQEMLRWASSHGCTSQGMRWGSDGVAILFRTEADAVAWTNGQVADTPEVENRRRRIMG